MNVFQKKQRKQAAIEKEFAALKKKEARLIQAVVKAEDPHWKAELEKNVPEKINAGLQSAFGKAFSLAFHQGKGLIERGCHPQKRKETYSVQDYAVMVKGGRRELKQLTKNAQQLGLRNMVLTTAEGVGLGALGIGLPDIVLFVGMLLKGIYETALSYGFSYDTPEEQYFILHMMEAAFTKGPAFIQKDGQVERLLVERTQPDEEELQAQMQKTSQAFAMEMLLLKFVQGLPVVGILGGASNPIYYHKVMRYVQLKYQKRYLLSIAQRQSAGC